jgi:5-hydroxyisourate hydrolase-like protein (transthyretin family)
MAANFDPDISKFNRNNALSKIYKLETERKKLDAQIDEQRNILDNETYQLKQHSIDYLTEQEQAEQDQAFIDAFNNA